MAISAIGMDRLFIFSFVFIRLVVGKDTAYADNLQSGTINLVWQGYRRNFFSQGMFWM
jgi:hypothetical protein